MMKVMKEASDRAVPLEELSFGLWLWRGVLWGRETIDDDVDDDDRDDNDRDDDDDIDVDDDDDDNDGDGNGIILISCSFRWTKSWIVASKQWPSQLDHSSSDHFISWILFYQLNINWLKPIGLTD